MKILPSGEVLFIIIDIALTPLEAVHINCINTHIEDFTHSLCFQGFMVYCIKIVLDTGLEKIIDLPLHTYDDIACFFALLTRVSASKFVEDAGILFALEVTKRGPAYFFPTTFCLYLLWFSAIDDTIPLTHFLFITFAGLMLLLYIFYLLFFILKMYHLQFFLLMIIFVS